MKKALVVASVVLAISAGSLAVQTVWALFSDSQSVTGSVSFTAETSFTDLYICDVTGTASTSPTCPGVGDDSGADEVIFETLEDMLPGETVQWDIRLRNVGIDAWDSAFVPEVVEFETADPGDGCGFVPVGSLTVIGKAGDSLNDNHPVASTSRWQREGFGTGAADRVEIHVEPGDFEDVRVRVFLSAGAGNSCLENVWDVRFTIGAVQRP